MVDERRNDARHGVKQRARWDEDFCGGKMPALDVTHRGGFVGGDESKPVEVVNRPEVVEPLGELWRGDFEKMLIQCARAAAPQFDFEAAGPRKQHVTVLDDVIRWDVGVAAVGSDRVAFTELGNLDDRESGAVAGRILLKGKPVQVVGNLVKTTDFPAFGRVAEGRPFQVLGEVDGGGVV